MWRGLPILLLALSLTACGSIAPSPSAAVASPTTSPTVAGSPTIAPTLASALLAPDAVAQVVTTDLVMRSAPGGGADSEVFRGALDAPTLLFVIDGPVAASGYDWYLVYPFAMANSAPPEHWRLGWVAAGSRDGEAWIAPAAPTCPQPDFDGLTGLSWIVALACYGDRPLTLEGSFGGSSYVVPGVVSPPWLGVGNYLLRPLGTAPDAPLTRTIFYFHTPDEAGVLDHDLGTPIRIVGHFDDQAAQTCVAGPRPGPEPTPGPIADEILADAEVVLMCRGHFVMTDSLPLPQ